MNKTVTIAPVRKSVRVEASQAHAFEVFTAGLDRWWPRRGTIGTSPLKTVTIEPRLGGRWYETGEDGSEVEVRFTIEGPDATLVELEHRKFERMGAEAGASLRKDVDGGWPGILERFRAEAGQ